MNRTLFLCLLLALALCAISPGLAMPTQAEIETVLKENKDISKDKRFTIGSKDNEVQISTYEASGSSNTEKDCKIDAVLFARVVMTKFPEVSRVAVNFHSLKGSRTYKQVTVTKPEILAFGSGQVEAGELLAAMRLEEKAEEQAQPAEEPAKTEHDEDKHSSSAESAKQAYKQAIAKGQHPETQWITYHAPGLAFDYPSVWRVSRELEGTTVVSLKSTLTTYHEVSIGLKLYRSAKKDSVMEEAREHAEHHQKYKGFKITKPSNYINFGKGGAIKGVCENFSHNLEGWTIYERHVYFGWPGYVYKFYCSSSREDYVHANNVFTHLLSTVRLESAAKGGK